MEEKPLKGNSNLKTLSDRLDDEVRHRSGSLQALEDQLFQLELDLPGLRQQTILQKLQERLLTIRPFTFRGTEYVLSPDSIRKQVEAMVGLQNRTRKKFLGRLSKLGSMGSSDLLRLVLDLIQLGIKVDRLFGLRIQQDSLVFHYIRDSVRFRHALGLADAVHMSLFNLGYSVRFPARKEIYFSNWLRDFPESNFSNSFKKRIRFKSSSSGTASVQVKVTSTKERKFRLLLHYLRCFPSKVEEKHYVKLIKLSMCTLFSSKMEQEMPEGFEDAFPIFPKVTQDALDRNLTTNKPLRARLYFNILQSKSLCAPVGQDMIDEAYVRHKDSLCRPDEDCVKVPSEFLRKLRDYGRRVGQRVNQLYDPNFTSMPNSRATEEKARHEGGASSALKETRTRTQGHIGLSAHDSATRLEPFVVGLFGPPGSGKTTLTQYLVRDLGKRFFPELLDQDLKDLVYQRSCSTKHWDGYTGQPIVILDDFGQNLADRNDIVEFEQLISVNRYILPMAELEKKGQPFISPIVILTSNCQFGSNLNHDTDSFVIEDSNAVWRRIKLPVCIAKGSTHRVPLIRLYNQDLIVSRAVEHYARKFNLGKPASSHWCLMTQGRSERGESLPFERTYSGLGEFFSSIEESFQNHLRFHSDFFSPTWRQVISQKRVHMKTDDGLYFDVDVDDVKTPIYQHDWTVYQDFPAFPPGHEPPVSAIALPEPLKVRMITKAEANCKALQPLQRALYLYLKEQPQFCLSNGCTGSMYWSDFSEQKLEWIYRIEKQIQSIRDRKGPDDLWLSGDYTAATDNFPMSVTNELLEGILESIEHGPTLRWARYECSSHLIKYPKSNPGFQTSGQLMGSLLSFPLLCFLNDFIVSESGFELGKYLINGDDVVACGSMDKIQTWKTNAPQVGLSLSLGKNYIDPDFCTVNSQLFYQGNCMHTGKVSCQTRHNASIGFCFQETQFYFGVSEEIKRCFIIRNIHELRSTPRSLDVSTTHGGLALITQFTKGFDHELAKRVYLYDFLKPFSKSLPVPGFDSIRAVAIPEALGDGKEDMPMEQSLRCMQRLRSLDIEGSIEDDTKELSHADLKKFEGTKKSWTQEAVAYYDNIVSCSTDLREFPSTDFLSYRYVFVSSGSVGFIKEEARALALTLLKKSIGNHDYLEYTGDWQNSVREELNEEVNLKMITDLFSDTSDPPSEELLFETFVNENGEDSIVPDLVPILGKVPKPHPYDLHWVGSANRFDLPREDPISLTSLES